MQAIFHLLLANNAHPAAKDRQQTRPMHILAAAGLTTYLVDALEPHMAGKTRIDWIDAPDPKDCNLLMLATRGNNTELMSFVLGCGVDANWAEKEVCDRSNTRLVLNPCCIACSSKQPCVASVARTPLLASLLRVFFAQGIISNMLVSTGDFAFAP